jgi:hypothetical protein
MSVSPDNVSLPLGLNRYRMVSNQGMRLMILSVVSLLLTSCVRAQGPSAGKREIAAIQRVKTLLISSMDHRLPKVTLEFFLKYEGEGAPIKWDVSDCGEQDQDAVVDHGRDSAMCVRTALGLKDGRAATVLVSIGTFKRGPVDVPTAYGVSVTYPDGTIHRSLERFTCGVASSTPPKRA